MRKPNTLDMYISWLKRKHHVDVNIWEDSYYNQVTEKVKKDFENSAFWKQLVGNLPTYEVEYQKDNKYPFFYSFDEQGKLKIKDFKNFLEKTWRKNVLDNNSWPEEPSNGWILSDNWLSRIDDVIRTLFTVKYLDGVKIMTEKIHALCAEHTMSCDVSFEAKEEGYYAAHVNVRRDFEIPRIKFGTEEVNMSIEIQVTTQVQEVIRKLLHTYYEKKRTMERKVPENWQWNTKCEEFSVNYLGHILHYVEGLIVEIKDKERERDK